MQCLTKTSKCLKNSRYVLYGILKTQMANCMIIYYVICGYMDCGNNVKVSFQIRITLKRTGLAYTYFSKQGFIEVTTLVFHLFGNTK